MQAIMIDGFCIFNARFVTKKRSIVHAFNGIVQASKEK